MNWVPPLRPIFISYCIYPALEILAGSKVKLYTPPQLYNLLNMRSFNECGLKKMVEMMKEDLPTIGYEPPTLHAAEMQGALVHCSIPRTKKKKKYKLWSNF